MKIINKIKEIEKIKLALIAAGFFSTFLLLAQNSQPWAPVGAEWYYGGVTWQSWPSYTKYISTKDTIVQGKTCSYIEMTHTHFGELQPEIMYQENSKVYYYYNDTFLLVYDFSANEGDTIQIDFLNVSSSGPRILTTKCLVDKIDSILISGVYLRQYRTNIIDTNKTIRYLYSYSYIEKIGTTYMEFIPLIGAVYPVEAVPILRCYNDNEITYKTEQWVVAGLPCDFSGYGVSNKYFDNKQKVKDVSLFLVDNTLEIEFHDKQWLTQNCFIKVIDINGQTVLLSQMQSSKESVDLSKLKTGLYIVQILDNENNIITSQKIMKL